MPTERPYEEEEEQDLLEDGMTWRDHEALVASDPRLQGSPFVKQLVPTVTTAPAAASRRRTRKRP